MSKASKGTPERARSRKVVSRVHERIRFRRNDFIHQLSQKIVNDHGFIAVEDFTVHRMVHNRLSYQKHCGRGLVLVLRHALFQG